MGDEEARKLAFMASYLLILSIYLIWFVWLKPLKKQFDQLLF